MANGLHALVSGFVENTFQTDFLHIVILTALLKISRYIRAKIMQGTALLQCSDLNKVKKWI